MTAQIFSNSNHPLHLISRLLSAMKEVIFPSQFSRFCIDIQFPGQLWEKYFIFFFTTIQVGDNFKVQKVKEKINNTVGRKKKLGDVADSCESVLIGALFLHPRFSFRVKHFRKCQKKIIEVISVQCIL